MHFLAWVFPVEYPICKKISALKLTYSYQHQHGERSSTFVFHFVSNLVNHRAFLSQSNWEFLMPSDIVECANNTKYGQCTMCYCTSLKKRQKKAVFFSFFCWLFHSAFSYKIPHCCYSEKYWFWTQSLGDHTTANTDNIWVHFYTTFSHLKVKNISFDPFWSHLVT